MYFLRFYSISLNYLLILAATLVVSPTLSTSRHASLDDHPYATNTGFRVPVRRVDSGKAFSKLELLQRAMGRDKQRIQQLQAMTVPAASDHHATHFDSPIRAGNGEFLIDLSVGTPPLPFSAILDTGSDLVWTQCQPCTLCFPQTTPMFDPEKSSSFIHLPCSNRLCTGMASSSCDDGQTCQYTYSYGDFSSTKGVMGVETFTFGNVSVPNVGFGCGFSNGGGFDEGAGLVGLGRGPISLVSQLKAPKFSYCLTPLDSNGTGMLQIGSLDKELTMDPIIKTTPLLKNPSSPTYYYLSLQGITVGQTRLNVDKSSFRIQEDGSGGMIIDTGTTITFLPRNVYSLVRNEFVSQMKLPIDYSPYGKVFDLCFVLPTTSNGTIIIDIEVPRMVFHFEGVDLELPKKNYFAADPSGVACLAMGSSSDIGMSVFGNFQQQDLLVVHDLVKETIGFVPTKCDQV